MRAAAQRRREEQLRRKRRVDVRHVRRRTMAADVRYKINSTGHIQVRHESMLTSTTRKIHAVHASMRASLLCDKAATSSRATRRSTCASHAKFPFFSHKWSRNGCDRALT